VRTNKIPWWEPKLGQSVKDAVNGVLDDNYINDGPVTRVLENKLAEIAGVRYGVATPSCTVGLAISLMAAGVGHGDEVIVPDVTFIATANAVKLAGADVKLVDVDLPGCTINVDCAEEAIGPKTKAIIAVDFNGRSADYPRLSDLCETHGLTLICDSAEALGSQINGRRLGSFGSSGCFSFSGHKMFFGGQGGAVVTDDEAFYQRLRDLRDHGRRESGPMDDVIYAGLGFNFKFPNLLAAVVVPQLDELAERMAHAKQRDIWYYELLNGCNELSFTEDPQTTDEIPLWADVMVSNQAQLINAFEEEGIGYRRFWVPLHRQEFYLQPDYKFPNAIKSWENGIWLPSALSLNYEQADRVATVCRKVFG
jgi:perosamine synthetase